MKWHWYVGRSNELLLDLDSERAVWGATTRLQRNAGCKLSVSTCHFFASLRPQHYHMIITLRGPMDALERATWELHLGSDARRQQHVLMRLARGIVGDADFLIANRRYPGFRQPDYACNCKDKHKEEHITSTCRVLRHLLGSECSAEYFARMERLRLPFGRVPLPKLIPNGTKERE